ncbi:MAG: heavy metal translocating P-type ATPase [Prevotella sp.]|nr:heavy metal translocating P-type ATPase [Prevotella sp.]
MEKKTFAVLGMMCAGCSARVEKQLNATEGVATATVNLPSRTALVEYDESITSPAILQEALAKIGYDMVIEEDRNVEAIERRAYRQLLIKVVLSWLFALMVMVISMGYIKIGTRDTANQLMLILSLLNIVYCGRQFYVNAAKQLLHGSANMDTLVALSTGISFLFSAFSPDVTFFDASVMIITFVLTGRLLEERAKHSTASAIRSLMSLQPKTAHLVTSAATSPSAANIPITTDNCSSVATADGSPIDTIVDTPISALQPGDIIEVRPGEKIPVDGSVAGDLVAHINESMLTGESVPVEKLAGHKVLAGTICTAIADQEGTAMPAFRFRAEAVGQQTVLANIIRMVQEAQGSKAPVQRTVDKIALIFVPVVTLLTLLTFCGWYFLAGAALSQAILSAVSVLVIACPCAMGLATPTALMVGIGKAAELGILIKDATALEQLRQIDAMVIDKTGTLTLPDIITQATATIAQPATTAQPTATTAQPATLNTGRGSGPRQSESLKPHASEAIALLRSMDIDIHLMSGDREVRVAPIAREAGIDHYRSQVLPQDKEDLVKALQAAGHHVAMVGDGINDSQALATADVSIAMGRGTDVAMDVSQVTLMGDDLRRLPEAIMLSRKTVGMIHQNLFWAFVYNLVCIPLAAGLPYIFGFSWQITPMWAAALMACSSVSVVLNSLRLKLTRTSLAHD